MICPLLTTGYAADPEIDDPATNCLKGRCAWWNGGREMCGILILSCAADGINGKIKNQNVFFTRIN